MSNLFNVPIAEKIYKGFTGKLHKGTLTRTTSNYDVDTGEVVTTSTDYDFEGFYEDYNKRLITDGVVQSNDRKILILALSVDVDPSPGDSDNEPDTLTLQGNTFTVVAIKSDPARATWIVQGRL